VAVVRNVGTHVEIEVVRKGEVVVALVSIEDEEFVMAQGWCCLSIGYFVESKRSKRLLHRLVAERMGIIDHGPRIDHINGDKLDNRRENLRAITHAQNLQNRISASNSNSKSGIRGVWWHQGRKRWVAEVTVTVAGKVKKFVRYYKTKEAAAQTVRQLRASYHPGSREALEEAP